MVLPPRRHCFVECRFVYSRRNQCDLSNHCFLVLFFEAWMAPIPSPEINLYSLPLVTVVPSKNKIMIVNTIASTMASIIH